MKTKNDYLTKILGMSLTGPKLAIKNRVKHKRDQYLFYCNQKDFKKNKDFIQKILQASQKNNEIVITNLKDLKKLNPLEVFSFGERIHLLGVKVQSFPSFTEIFKNKNMKLLLWNELKKRV